MFQVKNLFFNILDILDNFIFSGNMEKGTISPKLAPPVQHKELALNGVPVGAVRGGALEGVACLLCVKLPAGDSILTVSEICKISLQLPFWFSFSF